jgi:hypothetical protein
VIDPDLIQVAHVDWPGARRIIRSVYPPIDLFEDIADPEDWALLIAAEQKTNPRLMEALGNIDLVPPARRVGGPGASYLMAPFTHVSPDRPSRFTDGSYGVFYAAKRFETALMETIHHHARFMTRTGETAGWTSQLRELIFDVAVDVADIRGGDARYDPALQSADYRGSQQLGTALRAAGREGIVYPSQRDPGGECVGLFFPDRVTDVVQGRHLDYHWDGTKVDLYRDAGGGAVFRIS